MLTMVCFQVIGHDLTIAMAAQAGQLELNVMMPVIAHALLQSLDILAQRDCRLHQPVRLAGFKRTRERCRRYAEETDGAWSTALDARASDTSGPRHSWPATPGAAASSVQRSRRRSRGS
ncbi:MAG: hypothetical protein MZV49_15545 [Rhodopseudomonas palustris]|nr:hypothetical protein [Rhodopseudomonas palustris]